MCFHEYTMTLFISCHSFISGFSGLPPPLLQPEVNITIVLQGDETRKALVLLLEVNTLQNIQMQSSYAIP